MGASLLISISVYIAWEFKLPFYGMQIPSHWPTCLKTSVRSHLVWPGIAMLAVAGQIVPSSMSHAVSVTVTKLCFIQHKKPWRNHGSSLPCVVAQAVAEHVRWQQVPPQHHKQHNLGLEYGSNTSSWSPCLKGWWMFTCWGRWGKMACCRPSFSCITVRWCTDMTASRRCTWSAPWAPTCCVGPRSQPAA